MNPTRLRARSFRSYADLDLDLPTGCVAIVGANGSGKSSLMMLIDLCLFGPPSRSLADYLSDDVVDESMEIELQFEHVGRTYRVRRTYVARGRGQTKVDFEWLPNDVASEFGEGWTPLSRETAAATQDLICSTIGLSRETFTASAFLAQGDSGAFSEAAPRDRKRILGEVLGLSIWDDLAECARRDKRQVEDELLQVANTLAAGEVELMGRPQLEHDRIDARTARDSATERIAETEKELATANELLAKARAMNQAQVLAERALEGAREAHGAALTRESELRDELARLQERLSGRGPLEALSGQLTVLVEQRDLLQRRTQEADERDRIVVERNRLLDQVRALADKAEAKKAEQHDLMTSEDPRCQACGQHVVGDAKLQFLATLREEQAEFARAATEHEEAADPLTAKIEQLRTDRPTSEEMERIHDVIQRAQHAREQLAALDEAASRDAVLQHDLSQCRESLPQLEAALKVAQGELRALLPADGELSLPELEDSARDLAAAMIGWRDTLNDAVAQLARCDERLERLDKIAADSVTARARRDDLQKDLDVLVVLEKAYGRDGIPALILEASAIPQLETESSRILTILGGAASGVELRTQRALKSGDGTRDALDIVIHTDTGERDYSTFSGGERTRIDLALRLALARLLADRRGAESKVLVIDEPDGLDESGFSALVGILNDLQTTFEKILVVSHHPDLQQAFDQTIRVARDNGRSYIAGDREPVLA